jgi:hypothetical protein
MKLVIWILKFKIILVTFNLNSELLINRVLLTGYNL